MDSQQKMYHQRDKRLPLISCDQEKFSAEETFHVSRERERERRKSEKFDENSRDLSLLLSSFVRSHDRRRNPGNFTVCHTRSIKEEESFFENVMTIMVPLLARTRFFVFSALDGNGISSPLTRTAKLPDLLAHSPSLL